MTHPMQQYQHVQTETLWGSWDFEILKKIPEFRNSGFRNCVSIEYNSWGMAMMNRRKWIKMDKNG